MIPTASLRYYPKSLRLFMKPRRRPPTFLPLVRFYTTHHINEEEEGLFSPVVDAHEKFMTLTDQRPLSPDRLYVARFCNNEEELVAPLKRFYGRDMLAHLDSPQNIAHSVVMHLDGAGQDVQVGRKAPSYVRLCSRNSPYISTTRHIYSTRRVLEFEQNHGDLLFDIVNRAKKLYILEVPRSLVINITLRNCELSMFEMHNILHTQKSLEDLQGLMSQLFCAPISDPLFVTRLWEFYDGDIQRIIDYYLYLSRINESLCLGVGNMQKFIVKECPNPFLGDLRSLDSRAGGYRFE
jgi:hypothetical protein